MTTVLIAVDESEESIEAARLARRLFGPDAEYLAINVLEHPLPEGDANAWYAEWGLAYPTPFATVWPYPMVTEPGMADTGGEEAAAGEARSVARRSGLDDADVLGDVGDPADAILAAAEEHNADVIVVGSHGRGWFSRLLSPSVAAGVVKRANRPVLVAK